MSKHVHTLALPLLLLPLVAQVQAQAQAQEPPAARAEPARLSVRQFLVTGNTLLPEAVLQQTLDAFKGERSLAELQQAAVAVQERYRQAGYGAVVAYLPEQRGEPGIVTIAVLEGRIRRVVFTGNQRNGEDALRHSLPALREGATPQPQRLDAQIQLANEDPARQLAVSLEPGPNQGEVDAQVQVREEAVDHWTLAVDNTGNSSTGRLRAALGYQRAELWGLDHVLSLQFQTAPEKPSAVSVLSAGYRVPLYGAGLMLDLFAAHSDVNGGRTATVAGPLEFGGKGEVLGLRLGGRLSRQGDWVQRLVVGADRRAYLNDCRIEGLPAGACGSAGESVAVYPLTADYTLQWTGDNPASLQLTLSQNLDLGGRHGQAADFAAVRPGATPGFMALKVQAARTFALPDDWQMQLRLQAQFTPDALVPGEQLGLGGASAVRGYMEREAAGDQGGFGTVELMSGDASRLFGGVAEQVRGLAFVDAGTVRNHAGTPCIDQRTHCTLASVGVGLRAAVSGVQLHFDLARTLKPGLQTGRHRQRLHLSATYSFS